MSNPFFDWVNSVTRFVRFDAARAEDVNDALDQVTTGFDGVQTKTNAALKLPDGETATTFGNAAARKGKLVSFNASTGAVEATISTVDVSTVAGIASDVTTVSGIAANVTTVAGISADVTTVAGNNANVTTVAGVSGNVTTVATNIANVNAVGSDLLEPVSEINTVATDIANVNTVGTGIANVNTVAGISADVTTVAGISANVTTVATNNANVTAVAGNATNINNVAGNATNINTVAGISGNVTTVAGISSDVTAVAGISSDVSAVAAQFIGWNFSTTTTMADPGSGIMRFNNATVSSVTAIAFDDNNSAAADVSNYVLTWDDATSTNKGTLTIRQGTANYAIFTVTGLTDNAGWTQVAVTYVSHSGTFNNATLTFVDFDRTGDAGTGDVSSGPITTSGLTQSTAKLLGRYSASTGAIQEITVSTGLSLDESGNLTAAGGVTTGKAIAMALIFS